jgi:hypothetical protein
MDSQQRIEVFLTQKQLLSSGGNMIGDGSEFFSIPDPEPGVKKALDSGSGSATLGTGIKKLK